MDLIGMMGIIFLLFSSVGISVFGGYVNSKSVSEFGKLTQGDSLDDGLEYYNFNDYMNAFLALYTIILAGWQDLLEMNSFANDNRSMFFNYYFVAFFVVANIFLLNILIGFIIDNIVAYLSEDIELVEEEEEEEGLLGTMTSLIKKGSRADLSGIGKLLADKLTSGGKSAKKPEVIMMNGDKKESLLKNGANGHTNGK